MKKHSTKKQDKKKTSSTERDQFTVVLEDLRSQFKAFGEGLLGLNEKVDRGFERMEDKFSEIDRRFLEINIKLDGHSKKLDSHSAKLDSHSAKLDSHSAKLDSHSAKLDSHSEMIAQLLLDMAEIKNDIRQKVHRDEFAKLEKRVLLLERRVRS